MEWAEILDAAFTQSGNDAGAFSEQFPELNRWARSTSPYTHQWAYVLEPDVLWEDRGTQILNPKKIPEWDAKMHTVEENLRKVQATLMGKLKKTDAIDSFLSKILRYSKSTSTGGWRVNVHSPMAEVAVGDTTKKNELSMGTNLVADLIVLGPGDSRGLMKVGWAEGYGQVPSDSDLRLRALPTFKQGLDDDAQKRLYFSSMFQLGSTW